MEPKIKIALADDEILIREGIKNILKQEGDFEVLFDASNGKELLEILEQSVIFPDIILMDINMPEYNGVEATKYISQNFPTIAIIALSTYTSEAFMEKMISVGAVCYIPKNITPEEMMQRIKIVYHKGFYYEEHLLSFIKKNQVEHNNAVTQEISEREIEVLKLICLQKSSIEIAQTLKISHRTADGHRNNLLAKTNSKNIAGLVVYAIQNKHFLPGIEC